MFIVKQKNADHPRGIKVSRVYNSRQAAEDLAEYLRKRAPDAETKYWTTEWCPREKMI